MDLREKLHGYVEKFNALDEETCVQAIPNARAYEWLAENIPLLRQSPRLKSVQTEMNCVGHEISVRRMVETCDALWRGEHL